MTIMTVMSGSYHNVLFTVPVQSNESYHNTQYVPDLMYTIISNESVIICPRFNVHNVHNNKNAIF